MSGSPLARTDHQLSARSRVLGTNAPAEDAALVKQALSGEADAFDRLVLRYQKVLYNVALKVTGNPEDARDITQTAFLRAWEHLESFDPRRRFFSWLYRIALNLSITARSRRVETTEVPESLHGKGPDPMDDVLQQEVQQDVERAVNELPHHYREVVILRHMAELSYREIAEAINLPERTVKSRLFTARRLLAEVLSSSEERS